MFYSFKTIMISTYQPTKLSFFTQYSIICLLKQIINIKPKKKCNKQLKGHNSVNIYQSISKLEKNILRFQISIFDYTLFVLYKNKGLVLEWKFKNKLSLNKCLNSSIVLIACTKFQ